MSFKLIFYKGNSQFLKCAGVKDQSVTPNTYLNAGTATGTMYSPAGAAVAGCTNVTGVYQTSSNGEWRFAVDPALFDPPVGGGYVFKVSITQNTIRYYVEYAVTIKVRSTGTEV
jgi:hypothetical protein